MLLNLGVYKKQTQTKTQYKNHTKIGPTVKGSFDPRVLTTALINIHFSRGRLNENVGGLFLIFKCLAPP